MQQFFSIILIWWFVFFALGIIFLPLTLKLFSSFFDKGYLFSKILGLAVISYTSLLLGVLHIAPFSQVSLLVLIAVFAVVNYLLVKKTDMRRIKEAFPLFVCEELIFFGIFVGWSYVRGFQPDIHGLEKFMDFGFVNSILRTTYFPPKDMWLTPNSINYYYFGHLATAIVTKLAAIPSYISFNLMIATLCALTFTGSLSLGGNLFYFISSEKSQTYISNFKRFILAGLLTGFLLTFAGNLHTLYTFFTPYQNDTPIPPWQLVFSPQTFPNQYWYPNATRFIYHTIHEFPIYSFVVSDLHGHVLDIPFVLLTLGVFLSLFKRKFTTFKPIFFSAVGLGGLCAIMYMTNAWDGLIYALFSGIFLLYTISKKTVLSFLDSLFSLKFLLLCAVLLGSFAVVSLPFSLFFKPFASQVGLVCPPHFLTLIGNIGPLVFEQGYCQRSPWWQLFILYGFFLFWFVSFLFIFFKAKKSETLASVDTFVFLLGLIAILLIIAPEFVYLKDIYTTYFRANTMFKLVYQAFIMLSITSSYAILRIYSSLQIRTFSLGKTLLTLGSTIIGISILSLVSIYPYFATNSYYNNLTKFQGLDGLQYFKTISSDDYAAIQWMNKHITGQPAIVEAQGDSYTDYERISSNTGLPTILGWTVHEWLWRGTYDVVPGRIQDVQTIYESRDLQQTKSLLRKYNIHYVIVGNMERTKYSKVEEEKFNTIGKVVFTQGKTTIYNL